MANETSTRTTFLKGVAACVVAAASLGIIQIGEYSVNSGTASTGDTDLSYTPGTYTASSQGMDGDVTVTATFDESSLTNLDVDVSGETAGIGAEIGDEMTQKFLDAQSSAVDAASGATVTSDALKAALDDCIAQATGENPALAAPSEEESEETSENEAEEAIIEPVSEDQETEGLIEEAGKDTSNASYIPGTYTASSQGMDGDVTVTATFDESSITDLDLDVSGETAGIGAEIGDEMTQKFLDAQSSDVDAASGATVTSDALKAALDDCIAQAAGESSALAAPSEEESEEASEPEAQESIIEPVSEVQETDAIMEEAGKETSDASYTPGTYTASSMGMDGAVTVAATFDETGIKGVSIDVSGETAGIGADIGDEMSEKFLDAQGSDVDAVSGATVTSNALIEAMDDCIAQASGGSTDNSETEKEENETSSAPLSEAEAAAGGAAAGAAAESAKEPESEDQNLQDESSTGIYNPGEYTADVEGAQGDITISVTFTEDEMVSISYDLSGETADIGAVIGPEMSSKILEAQSTDVDGVSGATVTSDAFKNGVEECISQAANESASLSTADLMTGPGPVVSGTGLDNNGYIPGTYTAVSQGMDGAITLSLTFNEDSIISVGYDLSGETENIGAAIGPEISAQILDAQSADIDGVSGATVTSEAVKTAAQNCIEQAMDSGVESANTQEPLASYEETSYIPGTYTATAEGQGTITVSVQFNEDRMISISYDLSSEEENIGPEISSAILESQSAQVDDILDAEITSEAFKQAVLDCMEQAKA